MTERCDVLIVGAGPAGMNAAIGLRAAGHHVIVVDDQPSPGGQVWRNVEATGPMERAKVLGAEYMAGREVVARFRVSGVDYRPSTEVWQIELGWSVRCRSEAGTTTITADHLLIACGAQERPAPFPGWTLPGVVTVGAAQILLKTTGDIPASPVWIAGSGPLCLLYMRQLIESGGEIAGFLHTGPIGNAGSALAKLPRAMAGWRDLSHGLGWIAALRRHRVPVIRVRGVEAVGADRIESIRYVTRSGRSVSAPASVLLVHEGVIPSVQMPAAAGCKIEWNEAQASFVPQADAWGATGIERLYLAGDVAGIGGAKAAALAGAICAFAIDARLRGVPLDEASEAARLLQRARARELAIRPLLDALYRPKEALHAPADDVIVCRCEEVTAGEVRAAIAGGSMSGHNEVKGLTRAGMGMCQGRQCGMVISALVSRANARPISAIGLPNVRPPLRPITLGEITGEALK